MACTYSGDGIYVRSLNDYVSRTFSFRDPAGQAMGDIIQAIAGASKMIGNQVRHQLRRTNNPLLRLWRKVSTTPTSSARTLPTRTLVPHRCSARARVDGGVFLSLLVGNLTH
mmetsp:Transcript_2970/g.8972  ORF Transcript_2970/g.8972 Transcript_2970/m.8972 type:complete len:112 (+) Transcript_2970:611-946(+)